MRRTIDAPVLRQAQDDRGGRWCSNSEPPKRVLSANLVILSPSKDRRISAPALRRQCAGRLMRPSFDKLRMTEVDVGAQIASRRSACYRQTSVILSPSKDRRISAPALRRQCGRTIDAPVLRQAQDDRGGRWCSNSEPPKRVLSANLVILSSSKDRRISAPALRRQCGRTIDAPVLRQAQDDGGRRPRRILASVLR